MMKHTLLLGLVLLCCAGYFPASAQDPSAIYWKKANAAYLQKQYDSAIFYYEQLLSRQPGNASVYYNLGNTYYKSNQVGKAVLQYERALFFDPALPHVQDNLLLAKSRIPNAIRPASDIFFVRWWDNLTNGNTSNTWALLSLLIFLCLCGTVLLAYSTQKKKVPTQLYFFLPLLLLLTLYCAHTAAEKATHTNKAVIMGTTAAFTSSPGVYKGQSLIPEATTVLTGVSKGSWVSVTLPDNRSGWMQRQELTFVQPAALK